MALIYRFLKNERGATAIEYAMIAGGISILCVVGATSIGSSLTNLFLGPVAAALN